MRFSIIAGPRQNADIGQSASEAWWNYVDDAVRAEELGFDAAYIGEHHFCFASGNSSPLVMLTHMAARTERIRLGTSIICAPFHNPLRLAEDIAAVDIVSKGRFDLGIAVGSQWEEFQAFGIDPKERFARTWEIIDILETCLNSGQQFVEHHGKYYQFDKLEWILPPVQSRIPILWGGFGPKGVTRAAERGYHLIAPDFTGIYERVMREHGRDPADYLVGFVNQCSVAPTAEEAYEAVAANCLFVSNQYAKRPDLEGRWPPASALLTMADMRRGWETGESLGFSTPNAGTPEDMIENLLPLVRGEKGLITHIGLEFRPPGTTTEHVARSMTLFAREVLPVLRDEAARIEQARKGADQTAGAPA